MTERIELVVDTAFCVDKSAGRAEASNESALEKYVLLKEELKERREDLEERCELDGPIRWKGYVADFGKTFLVRTTKEGELFEGGEKE